MKTWTVFYKDGEKLSSIEEKENKRKIIKIFEDEDTGVIVEKMGEDYFVIHLGNKDFALEVSREELRAFQYLISEALDGGD